MSIIAWPPRQSTEDIPVDTVSPDQIRGYLEQDYQSRIFNPLEDSTASARLQAQLDKWRAEDCTILMTSGVFDVMHGNHRASFLAKRISAATVRYNMREADGDETAWRRLNEAEQTRYIDGILSSGLIKQVVSIDGDGAVAVRKGIGTGTRTQRPIYSWGSRARDVLGVSYATPDGSGARFLVDAVTVHDCTEPALADTMHQGIMEIGHGIRPDVWAVSYDSVDIIEALRRDRMNGNKFANVKPVAIVNGNSLYNDALLGGPFSTTLLTERILGTGEITAA